MTNLESLREKNPDKLLTEDEVLAEVARRRSGYGTERIIGMTTFLQVLAALPSLIQAIVELMALAEKAIPEKGAGQAKKDYVLQAIQATIGSEDLWKAVQGLFSKLINMLALFHFGSSGADPK